MTTDTTTEKPLSDQTDEYLAEELAALTKNYRRMTGEGKTTDQIHAALLADGTDYAKSVVQETNKRKGN